MAFSRVAALRSTIRSTRPTSFNRPQLWRQAARRGYASGGHAKSGGDAIWAVGSIAFTVPTCWWLLSNGPDTSHHGDHGSGHGASHHKEKEEEVESSEEESKEESKEEEPKAEEEDAKPEEDDKKSESSEDSDSEESKKDTPPSSDDEGGDDKVSESDEGDVTKKTYPDAKGGIKKRLESNKSIRQGADDSEEVVKDDKPVSSRPAASQNKTSGKQEGLSNTDTKHSVDIQNSPEKSTKGEGVPESSKLKGTVDPKRPIK